MITFVKPSNLNGTELLAELKLAGVDVVGLPIDDAQGNLLLDIKKADEVKAKAVVEIHNGTIIAPELTVADKLAQVGLSLDDLKAALGV
jgi:L-ascorbate metabolism protein UlaG (beta-lactamase superfamily)